MALQVVTPPAKGVMFISLEEAKAHLRIDFADDDELIIALILAAQDQVEDNTQRRYLAQQLQWVINDWGHLDRGIILPLAPSGGFGNIGVDQIEYTAIDGSTQVLDPPIYWVRPHGQTVKIVRRWFVIFPWLGDGAERVSITFSVEGDATTIPNRVKHAVKLLVSHWYENRDAVVGVDNRDSSTELPLGVEALLTAERWS